MGFIYGGQKRYELRWPSIAWSFSIFLQNCSSILIFLQAIRATDIRLFQRRCLQSEQSYFMLPQTPNSDLIQRYVTEDEPPAVRFLFKSTSLRWTMPKEVSRNQRQRMFFRLCWVIFERSTPLSQHLVETPLALFRSANVKSAVFPPSLFCARALLSHRDRVRHI